MTESRAQFEVRPKFKKILATVLHIMKEMPGCDQYKIVKTVFLADREHLNTWGRPVTFDTQWAMKLGPVPTHTYDLIRGTGRVVQELGLKAMPWSIDRHGNINHYTALSEPDYKALSRSDLNALNKAIATIKPLSFSQVHELAKNDPAYLEAWKRRGSSGSLPMRFDLLLDDGDDEVREEVCMDLVMAR